MLFSLLLAVQHERGPRKAKQHQHLTDKQQASPSSIVSHLSTHSSATVHLSGSTINLNTAHLIDHHR